MQSMSVLSVVSSLKERSQQQQPRTKLYYHHRIRSEKNNGLWATLHKEQQHQKHHGNKEYISFFFSVLCYSITNLQTQRCLLPLLS